jgi:hypothetical protein
VISRRVFLHAVAGGVLAPRAAEAQQRSKVPRIGYMGLVSAASHANRVEAFRTGLRDLPLTTPQTAADVRVVDSRNG